MAPSSSELESSTTAARGFGRAAARTRDRGRTSSRPPGARQPEKRGWGALCHGVGKRARRGGTGSGAAPRFGATIGVSRACLYVYFLGGGGGAAPPPPRPTRGHP